MAMQIKIKEKEIRMEIDLVNQVVGVALIMVEAEAATEVELLDTICIVEGQIHVVSTMVNMIGWSVLIMNIALILCQTEIQVEEAEALIEGAINTVEEAGDLAASISMVEELIITILIKIIIRENNTIVSRRDRFHSRDIVEPPL